MTKIVCKADYEKATAATRDERMAWFRGSQAIEPLRQTGAWIRQHADIIYPLSDRYGGAPCGWAEATRRGRTVWIWTLVWPHVPAGLGGFLTPLKSACLSPDDRRDGASRGRHAHCGRDVDALPGSG